MVKIKEKRNTTAVSRLLRHYNHVVHITVTEDRQNNKKKRKTKSQGGLEEDPVLGKKLLRHYTKKSGWPHKKMKLYHISIFPTVAFRLCIRDAFSCARLVSIIKC